MNRQFASPCLLAALLGCLLGAPGCGSRPPIAPLATQKPGSTVEQVCTITAELLAADRSQVNAQTSLADLGADELDFVELVMELEERFGISIPDSTAEEMMGTKDPKSGMKNVTMAKLASIVDDQVPSAGTRRRRVQEANGVTVSEKKGRLPEYDAGSDERLRVTKDPSDASRLICDVKFATFTTPSGWTANESDKNSYAVLSLSREKYPNLTRMISVDIGKPVEATTEANAISFAKQWGGTVQDASLSVGGEPALRVVIPPDGKSLRPIDCVLTVRNGRLFMIIAGATQNDGISSALDEIIGSWKWKN
jgi:acyl carrier protein